MECPYCNAENRDGVRFCNNCGKPLDPAAARGGTTVTSRSLTPGSRLQGGRYVIKKILGEGGMGAALLATELQTRGSYPRAPRSPLDTERDRPLPGRVALLHGSGIRRR